MARIESTILSQNDLLQVKMTNSGSAWLAQSVEPVILDLEFVSLDVEITQEKKGD